MSLAIPQIVARFPQYQEHILKARFQTAIVAEICRDYDTVTAALGSELSQKDRDELVRLATDLEQEMLNWLVAHRAETSDR